MAHSSDSSFSMDEISLEDGCGVDDDVSKRCLIGRILALKQLNKQAVSLILQGAWKVRASFSISPWNDNLYLFKFDEEDDRSWVMQEAPWSIMGSLLIRQPLVIGLPVAEMDFSRSPLWVQVHGLPMEKLTKANGEIIGRKIGKLIRVEAHCEGLLLNRNFLHIRVEVDVFKPLPRGFTLNWGGHLLKDGSNLWISFKCKRLSDFCFNCGRIRHERTACKFISRKAGRNFGYGPELRTGIARNMGLRWSIIENR
ncbi:hypothetical protein LOK49_LG06G01112 [Camellia lanceoleosa]|uniref:Uncharacterized protein n=1 Tax=Camellia lanceoleosa TaxID=1840588 RepID=A0ACC0HEF4_9ERIC|nr:hypothetical protein LOK49_LG06G01112 [Camellia lanceoleosa]